MTSNLKKVGPGLGPRKKIWFQIKERILNNPSNDKYRNTEEFKKLMVLCQGKGLFEMVPFEYKQIYGELYDISLLENFKYLDAHDIHRIEKDVPRTFSLFIRHADNLRVQFMDFKLEEYCRGLYNILCAASYSHGYCQGINFLAAQFLLHEANERNAFIILNYLLKNRHLETIFLSNYPCLMEYMNYFEKKLRSNNRLVYKHFKRVGFSSVCYAVEWFTTCFIVTCPGEISSCVLEAMVIDIKDIMIRTGLALLHYLQDELLILDLEGLQTNFKKLAMSADPCEVFYRALQLSSHPHHDILEIMATSIQNLGPHVDEAIHTIRFYKPHQQKLAKDAMETSNHNSDPGLIGKDMRSSDASDELSDAVQHQNKHTQLSGHHIIKHSDLKNHRNNKHVRSSHHPTSISFVSAYLLAYRTLRKYNKNEYFICNTFAKYDPMIDEGDDDDEEEYIRKLLSVKLHMKWDFILSPFYKKQEPKLVAKDTSINKMDEHHDVVKSKSIITSDVKVSGDGATTHLKDHGIIKSETNLVGFQKQNAKEKGFQSKLNSFLSSIWSKKDDFNPSNIQNEKNSTSSIQSVQRGLVVGILGPLKNPSEQKTFPSPVGLNKTPKDSYSSTDGSDESPVALSNTSKILNKVKKTSSWKEYLTNSNSNDNVKENDKLSTTYQRIVNSIGQMVIPNQGSTMANQDRIIPTRIDIQKEHSNVSDLLDMKYFGDTDDNFQRNSNGQGLDSWSDQIDFDSRSSLYYSSSHDEIRTERKKHLKYSIVH